MIAYDGLTEEQVLKAQLLGDYLFFARTFYELKTGREFFIDTPPGRESHVYTIARELMDIYNLKTNRLVINVPPGHHKPLFDETLVLKDSAERVMLKDIKIGDNVLTHTGKFKRVNNIFHQGMLPSLKITTFSGREIITAYDHTFLTAKGWKQANELEIDDILGIPIPQNDFGNSVRDEESRLLGYFIGDGSISGNNANITACDMRTIKDIQLCCQMLGFESTQATYNLKNKKEHHSKTLVRINISGGVRDWLREHGIADKNSYTKRVPKVIMSGNNRAISQFIGAYFACDGSLTKKGGERSDRIAIFTSVSKELLKEVQHLFVRLGIRSRLRTRTANIKTKIQGDKYISYNLEIGSQNDMFVFRQKIYAHHEKGDSLKEMNIKVLRFDHPVLLPDQIILIEPFGEASCMCLEIEGDHTFAANDIAVHNSTMICLFVCWCYANYADCNFLYISVTHELAEGHTAFIKEVMEMPLYRKLFNVHLRGDSKAKGRFKTTAGGVCAAFGAQGTIVGANGGLPNLDRFSGAVLMDDMHLPSECHSETTRQKVIENFKDTIEQRARGVNVPFIFIGQRLHEDDLPAFFLNSGDGHKWKHVVLAALDENDNPLYPNAFPKDVLLIKRETDRYNFWSQMQQQPQPPGGGIFQKDDFILLDTDPLIISSFITCDTAETALSWNDASAFSFFGVYKIEVRGIDTGLYGLHWLDNREIRVEPRDLESEFFDFYTSCMRYKVKPTIACIEKKSTGVTLCSVLKGIPGLRIMEIDRNVSSGSKMQRFFECQPYAASHRITLTRGAKHVEPVIEHMRKITGNNTHAHDDICDSFELGVRCALIEGTLLPYEPSSSRVLDILTSDAKRIDSLRKAQMR